MSALVEVDNLTKKFVSGEGKTVVAVKDLSFEVQEGELFTLLGPSGCGKTTTLRSLAGFEDINEGSITLKGEVVSDADRGINLPPERRDIGFVFQSYAVWPHMTARENILYALKNQGYPKDRREERVKESLELVGLPNVEDRYPSELSGGQQQRIAFARAISYEPSLLLMDEPLSNLDFQLRKRMRQKILEILDEVGITTVYVTHDQEEAFEISDDICVMKDGEKMQQGRPDQLYNSPRTPFVANFIGEANVFNAELKERVDDGTAVATISEGTSELDVYCRYEEEAALEHPVVVIRPEKIGMEPTASSAQDQGEALAEGGLVQDYDETAETNIYQGDVTHRIYRGASIYYDVQLGDIDLSIRSPYPDIDIGTTVDLSIQKQNALIVRGHR